MGAEVTAKEIKAALEDVSDDQEIFILHTYHGSHYALYQIVDVPFVTHYPGGERMPQSEQFFAFDTRTDRTILRHGDKM